MIAFTKEIMEEVEEFIEDNKDEVITKIKETDNYVDNWDHSEIDQNSFEFVDFFDVNDHLCGAMAKVLCTEVKMIDSIDGRGADDSSWTELIQFFVDRDENGNYYFSYPLDKNGNIDAYAMFVEP